jgi:ABC-2 type transport system permease protein
MMALGTWLGLTNFAARNAGWPSAALVGSLAINLGLLMLCWAAIAIAIGCACRRRGSAGAIAGLLALTAYLTDYIGRAWKPAESIAWLSPFRYYSPFDLVLGSALPARNLYVLGSIAVAGFAVAYLLYSRRDISH